MSKIEVNTGIEDLQKYITLPELKDVRWIIREMGKHSEREIGPVDLELFCFSPEIDSATTAFISEHLSLNESDSETIYIDSSIALTLGIKADALINFDNFFQINGKVYDAEPVLRHFTTGVVALTDIGIIIIAGTT